MNELFAKLAHWTSRQAGRPYTFLAAVLVILVWAITGPLFGFSDTWQLVINTGTTIVTFLMVFLIQNTQNRDTQALHLKLDELIRTTKGAQNSLMTLEDSTEAEIDRVKKRFAELCEQTEDIAEDVEEIDGRTAKLTGAPRPG